MNGIAVTQRKSCFDFCFVLTFLVLTTMTHVVAVFQEMILFPEINDLISSTEAVVSLRSLQLSIVPSNYQN